MKIGYFADGPWSHKAFEKISELGDVQIEFICPRFDSTDLILEKYAKNNNIPFLIHPNINSQEFLTKSEVKDCDLFVSMSFNQIFKKDTLSLPSLGTINCHAGKLPLYRGRNILNWALINDEKEFGITVHYIDEGVDTGDIIKQNSYEITDQDDYSTLLKRAYTGCADILTEAIEDFLKGQINRISQNSISPHGSYCPARKEGDEKLDWNQSSRDIFNFVRSICEPGPSARSNLGDIEVKINKVSYFENAPNYKGIPGAILAKVEDGLLVKTLDSYLSLQKWECSIPIKVGDRLN